MAKLNYNEIFAFIVPTGVGASIGGYAGDASQWARKFASIRPTLVNANVVNAACFSGVNENILYAEGWSIDEFFAGNLNFLPSINNKIGVIFDKAIPDDVLNVHINTINAVKTVYGINVIGYEITSKNVGVDYGVDKSGVSSGKVDCPETLVEAGEKLLKQGATTLAIVCLFPEYNDEYDTAYADGNGVDPIGGIESVISHYVSQKLFVPSVHAPAFLNYQINSQIVDKKAAAEYITPTFLPCLLLGLNNAPLLTKQKGVSNNNVKALIMPYSSLGSSAVFDATEKGITVFAVKENKTVLNVTNIPFLKKECIIVVDTYQELYEILEQKYEK